MYNMISERLTERMFDKYNDKYFLSNWVLPFYRLYMRNDLNSTLSFTSLNIMIYNNADNCIEAMEE